ncbi:hypothetical protein TNCV_3896221 [Trichonephila clavipes]|nr:hypothetical protein TNCV_3896221 [Trichonephila clavipes]
MRDKFSNPSYHPVQEGFRTSRNVHITRSFTNSHLTYVELISNISTPILVSKYSLKLFTELNQAFPQSFMLSKKDFALDESSLLELGKIEIAYLKFPEQSSAYSIRETCVPYHSQ